MLRDADLPLRILGTRAHFDFLGPQDEPWLSGLIEATRPLSGAKRRQLAERLSEPLVGEAPPFKRRAAARVWLRLWRPLKLGKPSPARLREHVFPAAAAGAPRERVFADVAEALGIEAAGIEEALFADLPGERRLEAPCPLPSARELALRTNLAIAQAALMRAAAVELQLLGNTRNIVKIAKLQGLMCVVKADASEPHVEISGPFSLFRHTLLYGRALASLVPHLAWCPRFSLSASAQLRGQLCDVSLDHTAPLFPAAPPRAFDSRLEARFAAEVAVVAPDWDVIREPEPLAAAGTLVFPDFLLQHRIFPERRAFVELVGFWTERYLSDKFARLRATGVENLVLCLDADRACAASELPPGLPVVPYRKKVDAAAVMREVERLTTR